MEVRTIGCEAWPRLRGGATAGLAGYPPLNRKVSKTINKTMLNAALFDVRTQ